MQPRIFLSFHIFESICWELEYGEVLGVLVLMITFELKLSKEIKHLLFMAGEMNHSNVTVST